MTLPSSSSSPKAVLDDVAEADDPDEAARLHGGQWRIRLWVISDVTVLSVSSGEQVTTEY